ncbi:MAG: hypothetical protein ACI865_002909 [Flavobacteriaceae bacterium]|jgi:hypothetical protein
MRTMINKTYGILLVVMLIAQGAFAQPPNDACGGALATAADGTCYGPGLAETTTVAATDGWIGTLGCAGNNAEVWFSFVATTSQLDINITAGTIGGNIEFVLVQSVTPPCGGLTLGGGGGSACGASPLIATFNGLQIGGTYYYTISSTGSDGTFTSCLTSTVPTPVAGQDCSAAAILCDDSQFSQGTSAAGAGADADVSTANSCWGSGGERQSKWFHFTVGCSGTLEFMITPATNSNDYDWGLWDITGDLTCGTKGSTIACDWSGCPGATGLSSCPASETGANNTNGNGPGGCGGTYAAVNAPINVTAGNTYALLVDNFSTSNSGFSLTFGGACGGGTAVIGPDANFTGSIDATCMIFTGLKVCATTNSAYLWDYGDGSTSTGMNGSHTYATTGGFTVSLSVTDELGCTNTTSQVVNIGCLLPIELASFDAEKLPNNDVQLNWTTASEEQNDYFTIERGTTGNTFEEIGTVDGAGNSTEILDYQLIDRSPLDGTSYYRIKQTDFDGVSTYTNTIAVNFESTFDELAVYPNPVKDNSVLSFIGNATGETLITVMEVSGKLLMTLAHDSSLGKNTVELKTAEMNSGVYFLTIQNDSETKLIKFVKQ